MYLYSINTSHAHLILPPKTPDLVPHSPLAVHFGTAILCIGYSISSGAKDALVLPSDTIKELKVAGLLKPGIGEGSESSARVTTVSGQQRIELKKSKVPVQSTIRAGVVDFSAL